MQGAPISRGLLPVFWARGKRTALEIVNGFFVGSHHTRTSARLNGHIADGHAPFYAQRLNGTASKLYGIAGTTGSPNLADNGQHNIFCCTAGRQSTLDTHQHIFCFFHQQGLGCQNVLNFRCAYTKGQCGKSTMG